MVSLCDLNCTLGWFGFGIYMYEACIKWTLQSQRQKILYIPSDEIFRYRKVLLKIA